MFEKEDIEKNYKALMEEDRWGCHDIQWEDDDVGYIDHSNKKNIKVLILADKMLVFEEADEKYKKTYKYNPYFDQIDLPDNYDKRDRESQSEIAQKLYLEYLIEKVKNAQIY